MTMDKSLELLATLTGLQSMLIDNDGYFTSMVLEGFDAHASIAIAVRGCCRAPSSAFADIVPLPHVRVGQFRHPPFGTTLSPNLAPK